MQTITFLIIAIAKRKINKFMNCEILDSMLKEIIPATSFCFQHLKQRIVCSPKHCIQADIFKCAQGADNQH